MTTAVEWRQRTRERYYRLAPIRSAVLHEIMGRVRGDLLIGADGNRLLVQLTIDDDAPSVSDELVKFTSALTERGVKWSKVEIVS